MPAGPMNQPYQPEGEQQPAQPGLGLPVPSNQVTTKPRQMPSGGDSGPSMPDADFGDGVESASVENAQPPMPDIRAKRHMAYLLTDVMTDVLDDNPGIGSRQAYLLARRAVEEYGLDKTGVEVWHPLDYGNRGNIPDGPISHALEDSARNGNGKGKGIPENSPSRHQRTVQEQHANVLGEKPKSLLVPDRDAPGGWRENQIQPGKAATQ